MPQALYLGQRVSWDDTSNAAFWVDLEGDAQAIRIHEYISQSVYSFEIETNALATVFGIRGGATTTDMIDVASSVTTANVLDLGAASLTTGTVIDISDLAAITTGKAIHVDATGTTHTTGVLVHIDSAGTAITGAGRLLRVDHTGATTTSGVVAEVASAATDETTILRVTASAALAAGVVLDLSGASVTTGTILDIGGLDALTTGKGLNIVSDSSDTGAFVLAQLTVDNTAATGAIPLSIQMDAANEAVFIDHNADGQAIFIDHDDTGTANSIEVDRDGNNAADIYGLKIACDNAGAGNGFGIDLSSFAAGEITINFPDGSASSIDPSATAESGWINIGVAGTVKYVPYYAAS